MIQSFNGIEPKIGNEVYIHPSAVIIGNVIIGDHCSIWPNAVIRGDINQIIIGDFSNIQDGVVIHTNSYQPTEIGCYVTVGHSAHLHSVRIEDEVLIGSCSVVLDGSTVETHSIVAAGAVVSPNSHIPSRSMVMGLPGKIKRELSPEEIGNIRINAEHYVETKTHYLNEAK